MLLTIERVLTLKTVGIFSTTPEDALADLASMLEEVRVKPGEAIIEKGEIGTSLYIVVSGKVRVHDGDTLLAELGERSVFGELAALDPEPRLASVSAVDETLLFRLEHEALYDMMAEHIEVVRGVVRMLCQRLRSGP